MYREIKFRVWDKDYKRMHTVGDFHHDSLEIDEENNIFFFNLQCMEGSPHKGINPEECAYRLMQYTGLKDKNGKEIYEEDILQFYNDVDYIIKPGYAKVVFKDGAFCCKHFKYGTEYLANMDMSDMDITVVGNIYENPELLEGN